MRTSITAMQAPGPTYPEGPDVTEVLGGQKVSVIIPALNEAANLPYVLPRIPAWVHEVILVDDHCTDETVAVAISLLPRVRIVGNERAPGKGNALRAGYAAASGDILVQLDADGSEAPEEIIHFVGALLAGADLAKGSRFAYGGGTSDMTGLRRYGNFGFVLLVWLLYGVRFTDLCYGYNAIRREALNAIDLDVSGFEVEAALSLRALDRRLKIVEVPSFEAPRVHGEGRLLTFRDGWRVLRTIAQERMRSHHRPGRGAREALQRG
jgi:glycosyltransferase involved in cell wall biosynthesis